MDVDQLTVASPLAHWAAAIGAARWDEGNAIDAPYTERSLARFLETPGSVFVLAHEGDDCLGMASGVILTKPYGDERWLYVDEVDVAVPHRRRGVGRALMRALLRIAEAADCEELWLGTEHDNTPALALYRGLDGEAADVVGFTFEL